jgi:large subunit ribosomal protein L29
MKENADKLRALDAADMGAKLTEGAETMFRLRFQMSMGQTDGLKKLRQLRKERARILTILKQRGEEAPRAAAPAPPVRKGAVKKAPKVKAAAAKQAKAKKETKAR